MHSIFNILRNAMLNLFISSTFNTIDNWQKHTCTVILCDNTSIAKSIRKFEGDVKPNFQSTDAIKKLQLVKLQDQLSFQKVTIFAKVLNIGDTNTLEDGRKVETILVGDHTNTAYGKTSLMPVK